MTIYYLTICKSNKNDFWVLWTKRVVVKKCKKKSKKRIIVHDEQQTGGKCCNFAAGNENKYRQYIYKIIETKNIILETKNHCYKLCAE